MERVLITGGAGLLGSHLADRLIALGHRVSVLDNLVTGSRASVPQEADLHEVDLGDSAAVRRAFSQARPGIVAHLAAQISVSASMRDPISDARSNVLGSLNVIEAAREQGTRKLVFASTGGAIYGEPDSLPIDETHPCRPASPYAAAKLAVEGYLGMYGRAYGLDHSILRFGNIYGPRQNPHGEAGVIAIFTRAMLAGDPVQIFGDGDDERDYVYVLDCVEAIQCAMTSGGQTAYNVASGLGVPVNTIFRWLRDLTGYRLEPVHTDRRPGDVRSVRLDPSKAKDELGWSPRTALEEGLQRTVDHFKKQAAAG